MGPRHAIAAMLCALGGLLLPTDGLAFSCGFPEEIDPAVEISLPGDGAEGVPRNTLLWLGWTDAYGRAWIAEQPPFLLLDPEGVEIPLSQAGWIRTGDGGLIAFRPQQLLDAQRRYHISPLPGDVDLDWSSQESTFTTGGDEDLVASTPPSERSLALHSDAVQADVPCGNDYDDSLWFRLSSDDPIRLLGGGWRALGVDSLEDGPWTALPLGSEPDSDALSDVGYGDGLGLRGWIGAGRAMRFDFGSLDLAGNFSGWSDPVSVNTPLAGCSSSREAGSAASLLLLVPGLRRRRRRLSHERGHRP